MDEQAKRKRLAAEAALDELPPAGVLGLGTGSTARFFVEALAARTGSARGIECPYRCVVTSEQTRGWAREFSIPLLDDAGPWAIDVTVDGADEVADDLSLIKGGGGAHTREKIVNFASRKNVIVVDGSKLSPRLGTRFPLPVEVVPYGHGATRAHLAAWGEPVLRAKGGVVFTTDSGNLIYDVRTGPLDDPGAVDRAMAAIPGVVATGLFLGRADVVLVADDGGVRRLAVAR